MRLTDLEDLTQYMSLDTKLLVQTEDFVNPVTAINMQIIIRILYC